MVKHTQTIHWQQLANCLSVFDRFVGVRTSWVKDFTLFFKGYVRHIFPSLKESTFETRKNIFISTVKRSYHQVLVSRYLVFRA